MGEFDNYERERDKALRSLDKDKILSWMKYYRVDWIPYHGPEFWIAVHKERIKSLSLPEEEIKYELAEIKAWTRVKKTLTGFDDLSIISEQRS